jgi:hypothetical protein
MSVNAQTWKAAEYDLSKAATETLTEGIYKGNADGYDVNQPSTLESSSIVVEDVEGIKMTAVSTPNNLGTKDIEEGKKKTFWELKGSTEGADALITSDCTPQFAQYLMPQGNPTFIYWDYEVEGQNGLSFKVGDIPEIYWTPGANMPAKGAYYKFAATKSGDLRVAIYGNKNANPTYIVDESTKQPLAPASVTVSIYYQNTGCFPHVTHRKRLTFQNRSCNSVFYNCTDNYVFYSLFRLCKKSEKGSKVKIYSTPQAYR